jgi:hypothetical protein
MAVDTDLRAARRPHADPRIRADARGRNGSVREELAVRELARSACEPVRSEAGVKFQSLGFLAKIQPHS